MNKYKNRLTFAYSGLTLWDFKSLQKPFISNAFVCTSHTSRHSRLWIIYENLECSYKVFAIMFCDYS